MPSLIEQDIEQKLQKLILKSSFSQIAQLISYAFRVNLQASNRRIFGYIPQLFREITIKNNSSNIGLDKIFIDEPVIYKIYFPSGIEIARIPYFYLFCYLKSSSPKLDVYFQSADSKSSQLSQQQYTLSQKTIKFQGIISAFENEASTICISDPGHFVPGFNSSYFVGSPEINFSQFISQIIENICSLADISLKDTFLFGASAGGVGALLSSTYFSSKVQVMSVNSQIDTYGLFDVMKFFMGTNDRQILLQKFGDRVSCIHRFQQNLNSVPNIYLLANINDNIYQKNYELYQLYQQRFVGIGKNNQSIFDSYYGFEGHAQPDNASMKAKIRFAKENLALVLNPSEQLERERAAAQKAELVFARARESQEQGDLERASLLYQKAIALKPEYKNIIELVKIYEAQKNYDDALKYCRYFMKLKPKHAYIHVWVARILKQQQREAEAIIMYQKAIGLKLELPGKVYQELGDLLKVKNDYAGAITIYRQALEYNPDWRPNLQYYFNLAEVLTKQEQFEQAIECYQKILSLNPNCTSVERLIEQIKSKKHEKFPLNSER